MAPPGSLRVAHFTDTWVPRRDGVVTALETLTTAMDQLGHDSLIVVPRHHGQQRSDGLLRLPSVPCGIAQFRLSAWPRHHHVEQVARWRPDVLHVHTPGFIGLLGVHAARALGLPLFLTYHTDLHAYVDAYRLPPHVLSGLLRCYARRLGVRPPRTDHSWSPKVYRHTVVDAATRLLYGSADTVIVPTDAVLQRSRVAPTFSRLRVVPTGVALRQAPPGSRATFRRRHGIDDSDPVVLYVGRLNREKGIDLLTGGFGELLRRVPDARLLLVGSAHDGRWVAKLLDRAGIADRTVRTGQLPPAEVAQAYAASDVFAFPSRTDTQGLVVQEAALAGLPIVLADPCLHGTGPLAGVGMLTDDHPVAYGETLARLVRDPGLARSVGQAAKECAERNSPRAYARTMAGVYGESVARQNLATGLLSA